MKPLIFIDGEAGTTGLQILARLKGRSDIRLCRLGESERKDLKRREQALNECDLAILCLPDDAAKQAVSLVRNPRVRILDASSAHRTASGWTYGLPEIGASQTKLIAEAQRVSNPGCYPTGAVCLLRPLVSAGLLPSEYPYTVNAVSGYSGAGKSLIGAYENKGSANYTQTPYQWYAVKLEHKHVEEMRVHALLKTRPIFTPAYGKYRQGIVLQIPVHLGHLATTVIGRDLLQALADHYGESPFVTVVQDDELASVNSLEPQSLNGTNRLRIYVFHNDKYRQVVLAAVYDNLGKGASGAAVQNMNLMLGLTELGNLDLSGTGYESRQLGFGAG